MIKTILRPVYWFALDILELLTGKRDPLTPPHKLRFVGAGDFQEVGKEFFRYFVDLCELKPDARVLDVGCGIGRMAVPLTRFFTSGSYEGFDIVPKGIDWCTGKITRKYPNFRFQLADVHNKMYNPGGRFSASEYRFPYPDDAFDFIFLTSVFTHMLPADMENYVSEIARVLKPGAKALITHFLINGESRDLIDRNQSMFRLRDTGKGYWTRSEEDAEQAIGYDEGPVKLLYKKHHLSIIEPIHHGSWCGRKDYLSFQDIVTVRKRKD